MENPRRERNRVVSRAVENVEKDWREAAWIWPYQRV